MRTLVPETVDVTVRGFRQGRTPVTNAQYAPVVEAGRSPAPPWWRDPAFNALGQPVKGVTRFEACAYARWLTETAGGSWRHHVGWSPLSARSSLPPGFRYADYGFRVLRDVP